MDGFYLQPEELRIIEEIMRKRQDQQPKGNFGNFKWLEALGQEKVGVLGFRKRLNQTISQAEPFEITLEQVASYWNAPFYQRVWRRFWHSEIDEKADLVEAYQELALGLNLTTRRKKELDEEIRVLSQRLRVTDHKMERYYSYYMDGRPASQVAREVKNFDNEVKYFRGIRSWWHNISRKRLQLLYVLSQEVRDIYLNQPHRFDEKKEIFRHFTLFAVFEESESKVIKSAVKAFQSCMNSSPISESNDNFTLDSITSPLPSWSIWHAKVEQQIHQWRVLSAELEEALQQGGLTLLTQLKQMPDLITPDKLERRLQELEKQSMKLSRWTPRRKEIRALIRELRQLQQEWLYHRQEMITNLKSPFSLSSQTRQKLIKVQSPSRQTVPMWVQSRHPLPHYQTLETELQKQLHQLLENYVKQFLHPGAQMPFIHPVLITGEQKYKGCEASLQAAITNLSKPIPFKRKTTREAAVDQLREKKQALLKIYQEWQNQIQSLALTSRSMENFRALITDYQNSVDRIQNISTSDEIQAAFQSEKLALIEACQNFKTKMQSEAILQQMQQGSETFKAVMLLTDVLPFIYSFLKRQLKKVALKKQEQQNLSSETHQIVNETLISASNPLVAAPQRTLVHDAALDTQKPQAVLLKEVEAQFQVITTRDEKKPREVTTATDFETISQQDVTDFSHLVKTCQKALRQAMSQQVEPAKRSLEESVFSSCIEKLKKTYMILIKNYHEKYYINSQMQQKAAKVWQQINTIWTQAKDDLDCIKNQLSQSTQTEYDDILNEIEVILNRLEKEIKEFRLGTQRFEENTERFEKNTQRFEQGTRRIEQMNAELHQRNLQNEASLQQLKEERKRTEKAREEAIEQMGEDRIKQRVEQNMNEATEKIWQDLGLFNAVSSASSTTTSSTSGVLAPDSPLLYQSQSQQQTATPNGEETLDTAIRQHANNK